MKHVHLLVIILLSIFIACKKKKVEYNLSIERSKLINMLTDIYIAETAVNEHPSKNKDSLKSLYFTEIYEIHHVKEEEFKATIDKVSKDFLLNELIQKEVLDSLKKIQTYKYNADLR